MAIADDFSVAVNGNIRYTGTGSNYTVLEFHRYLGALMDDAQAAGDDLADITTDTIDERSTDQILTLNSPFNIDDTAAQHLYDGSITQKGGNERYSGLRVLGSVVAGTEILIIQDDKVLPAYWSTGINVDATRSIIMQLLIKSRTGGADIDGGRIITRAADFGFQYKEFPVVLGLANSVSALSTEDDLNNDKSDATIQGYTDIANVEGFQLLDIDGNGTPEEYYSQWDRGSRSVNDVYERAKWIQQRAHIADSGTDIGSNFVVDNATIVGQGQEFSARPQAEKLVEMRFDLKIGAGTPLGFLVAELHDSDSLSPAKPTGGVLATSEPVLVSLLTSTYQTLIFRFNDNVTLTADQEYFAVIRNAAGDASNYVHVRGLATTGADDGNRAEDTGTWAGVAADDLKFTVKSSPIHHSRAGEKFRGIDLEIVYDTEAGGPFNEAADEIIFWGTQVTYDTLAGAFVVGEYVTFKADGSSVIKNAGKVLRDTGTVLTIALENSTAANLLDNDDITGITSAATAKIATTITDQNRAGGEGVLLALDDDGTTGDLYVQLISGSAPVDNLPLRGRTSGATALVNTTVTARSTKPEFLGQSTGANIIGAYGIGFQTTDVGASDKLFDLTNTQRTPPNNVTFTVSGLVSGEDRILVGPRTGSALNKAQRTLNTTLSGAGEIAVVVTAAIPTSGTPQDGTGGNTRLRVQLDTGIYRRQDYTSYSGSTFVIPSTNYTGANVATAPRDVFIAYIDVLADAAAEAFQAVHTSDVDLLIRVRDGGTTPIKTIEISSVFGAASTTTAVTRQTDA